MSEPEGIIGNVLMANVIVAVFLLLNGWHYPRKFSLPLDLKTILGDGSFPEILFLPVLVFAFTQFTGEINISEFSTGIILVLLHIWYSATFLNYNVKGGKLKLLACCIALFLSVF